MDAAERERIEQRNALAVKYVRLAYKESGRAYHRCPQLRLIGTADDAFQEAMLAVLRSAEQFREDQGCKFMTFAARGIRFQLARATYKYALIRVPGYLMPSVAGLAHKPRRQLPAALAALNYCEFPVGATAVAQSEQTEAEADQVEMLLRLKKELPRLNAMDRSLLVLHFGLHGFEPQTYRFLGRSLGVTPERARQRVMQACRRLKPRLERAA